jgi:hypothetical protein
MNSFPIHVHCTGIPKNLPRVGTVIPLADLSAKASVSPAQSQQWRRYKQKVSLSGGECTPVDARAHGFLHALDYSWFGVPFEKDIL